MGSDTQGVQLCDPIEITAPVAETRESGGFAAIQPSQPSQLIEGQGPKAMALDLLEEPSEFFGGRLWLDDCVLEAAVQRAQEWPGVKLNSSITDMIGGLRWALPPPRRSAATGSW
jgi:hypothetical protein